MTRTLLLDLDGTLVDTVPDIESALNRLMSDLRLAPFDTAETAAMVGDGVAALVRKALASRGWAADDVRTAPAISAFSADYAGKAAVDSRPYPGVPALLRDLAADGWRLTVCTNKPEGAARALLDAVGLLPLLGAVGGGDSFPVRKPDPGHLLATLRLVGGTPATAVMIGDHANDVVAARGAGVRSIFVTWGYGPESMGQGADAVARDLRDLSAAIGRFRV